MKAPAGTRVAQIIELWLNGQLTRIAQQSSSTTEMAARLGMSADAMTGAISQARKHGYAIPPWKQLRPVIRHATSAPYTQGVDPDSASSTGRYVDDRFDASEWDDEPTLPNGNYRLQDGGETERVFDDPLLPPLGPGPARSTLLNAAGQPVIQWVKNRGGIDYQTIVNAALAAFGEMPRASDATPPEYSDEDLLAVYPIGDAHVGMLAWAPESGENFDLDIAERNLLAAQEHLVSLAPNAKHALIINIGDFTHADGPTNTTTKGTRVDVDGRWPRVIQTAIRILRRKVDLALAKHEHVTLFNVPGNHDAVSAIVIAIALAQFFENEPRVHVSTSPEAFHWYRFGENLIGATHSDKVNKPSDLLAVMAVDRKQDWGETTHRRMYLGHLHHAIVKEQHTLVCEWIPTLAASDAWHRSMGYRATREQRLDVFHRRFGHINRHIVGIEQIRSMERR